MNQVRRETISSAVGDMKVTEQDSVEKSYCFRPDFIGFSGHFPGYPILPAFIQIMTALTLVEEHKRCRMELKGVEKAKFSIPLHPEQEIQVSCRYRQGKDPVMCDIRLSIAEGLASSFRISLEKAGPES